MRRPKHRNAGHGTRCGGDDCAAYAPRYPGSPGGYTDVLAPLIAGVIMKKMVLAAASTLIMRVLAAMRVLALGIEP